MEINCRTRIRKTKEPVKRERGPLHGELQFQTHKKREEGGGRKMRPAQISQPLWFLFEENPDSSGQLALVC